MDFYAKYLKYKKKYLILKKQQILVGGNNEDTWSELHVGEIFNNLLYDGCGTDLINCVNLVEDYHQTVKKNFIDIYSPNLNNISKPSSLILEKKNLSEITEEDIANCVEYCKTLFKQIFENISTKNYPGENLPIPRPNHGVLNHMRCIKFGIAYMRLISSKMTPTERMYIFKNAYYLSALICSTVFVALLRPDEQPFCLINFEFSSEYYQKIYPNLNEKYSLLLNGKKKTTPQNLASSIFHRIILNKWFPLIDQIERTKLARITTSHLSLKDLGIENLRDNLVNSDFSSNLLRWFVHYTIISSGHYLDHCRGATPYSNMIKEVGIPDIFKILDIPSTDIKNFAADIVDVVDITMNPDRQQELETSEHTAYVSGRKEEDTFPENLKNVCRNIPDKIDPHFSHKNEGNTKLATDSFDNLWNIFLLENDITNLFKICNGDISNNVRMEKSYKKTDGTWMSSKTNIPIPYSNSNGLSF